MNKVSSTLAFVLGAFVTFSSAAQIQGFVSGYAPSDVDETKHANGAEATSTRGGDFTWSLGAEFLALPVGPLMVGGGLGFFSVQTDGGDNVMMPSIPLWGAVGVIGPEKWTARPYLEARVGYPIPATGYSTWWDDPLHFFVMGTVGVQLPYHMGVEFDCTYLTMNKHFSDRNVSYQVSTLKFGGSITVHFDLFKSSTESNKAADEKPAVESTTEDFSSSSSDDANAESSASEEQAYPSYGEESAEQPVDDSVTEDATAEPAPVEETAEQPADETAAEVTPEEAEAPAEESPAEEAAPAEEPAPEPVAEPAPEPEKKPAAKKKAAKKKTTKKATSKKKSSKSTKKKTTTKKKK